jgi:hypothetical protein
MNHKIVISAVILASFFILTNRNVKASRPDADPGRFQILTPRSQRMSSTVRRSANVLCAGYVISRRQKVQRVLG